MTRSILFSLMSLAAVASLAQTPDDIAAGRQAYMQAGCYQCHGTIGHGGVGPRLAPNPMPLPALTAVVRLSARNMPAYTPKILPDAQLQRIHVYLSSITASGSADQVPLLQ